MQLKDHNVVKDLLTQYPSPSLFFHRDLAEVNSVQLLSALMRLPHIPRDRVVSAWKSLKPAKHRVTTGEIKDFLATFRLSQRKALLFGFETRLTLEEVMLLKWNKAHKLAQSALALRILHSLPQHIFTDFTFWEFGRSEEAKPLMTLANDFANNSAMTWQEMSECYRQAILVDSESDRRELGVILSTLS